MAYALGVADDPRGSNYETKGLDGDPSLIGPADVSQDGGTLVSDTSRDSGRALRLDHIPTKIEVCGPKGPLNDLWIFRDGIWCVDQRFRDLVEGFEPGAHQFFPVEVYWSDRTPVSRKYLFNVCNRIDTVDRQRTTLVLGLGNRGAWRNPPKTEGRLVFSRKLIGNHHVWRDLHLFGPPLVSNAFAEALRGAGITGSHLIEYEEY